MKKALKKKVTKRTSEERSAAAKKSWHNRRLKAAGLPPSWTKPRSLDEMLEARGKPRYHAPTPEALAGQIKPKRQAKPKSNGHFDLTAREAMQKVLLAMQRHADGENANARGMVEGAISGLVSSLGYLEG